MPVCRRHRQTHRRFPRRATSRGRWHLGNEGGEVAAYPRYDPGRPMVPLLARNLELRRDPGKGENSCAHDGPSNRKWDACSNRPKQGLQRSLLRRITVQLALDKFDADVGGHEGEYGNDRQRRETREEVHPEGEPIDAEDNRARERMEKGCSLRSRLARLRLW